MVVALGPGRFYGSSLPRPRFYTDVQLSDDGKRVDPPVGVLDPLLSWAVEAHWSMGGLSFDRRRLQGRIEGSVKLLRAQEERKEKEKKKRGKEVMNVAGSGSKVSGSGSRLKLQKKMARGLVSDDEGLALPVVEDEAETETGSESGEDELAVGPTPIPPAPRVTRSGMVRRKFLRRALLDNDSDGEGNVRESVPPSPASPTVSRVLPTSSGERVPGTSPRLQKRKRARKLGEEFDRLAVVDSPASIVLVTSSGKRTPIKAPFKVKGKAVESSSLALVVPRKLGEEFDRVADAAVATSTGKRSVKNKGKKVVDAASPIRNSSRISPDKSSRRTRLS